MLIKKSSNSFTHKLIKVYSLLFAVPLLIVILIALSIFWTRQVKTLRNNSLQKISEYKKEISTSFYSMALAETIFTSNQNLLQTFFYTKENQLPDIINDIKNFTDEIDHIKLVMPQIYGMRVFVKNEAIPERWPVIFKEDRLTNMPFERWTYNYITDLMGNIESAKAPSVCLQSEMQIAKKHIGYIQITMKMEDVFSFLFNFQQDNQLNFVFKDGTSLFPPSIQDGNLKNNNINNTQEYINLAPQVWGKINKYINSDLKQTSEENETRTFSTIINGKMYIGAFSKIEGQNLVIVQINTLTKLTIMIITYLSVAIIVIFLSFLSMFLIIRVATVRLTEDLSQVIEGMNQVRKENYDFELKVQSDDEIGQMAETFTKMVKTIKKQIYRIETEHKLLSETEIKAMQNQINAHFLYNALETIKMQAELTDELTIVQSVTLLGKMMHYCLKWKNPEVTLLDEIEYIQCYVQFLNIRNDYFVKLEIDLPECYENLRIMKMLLQPIIENAFYHGIEPRGVDSTVKLYTEPETEKNILWLCIADYGTGMTEEELSALITHIKNTDDFEPAKKTSIGLKNIQERLWVFFGKEYELKIQSKKDLGTIVKIPIQLESKGKNN